MFKNGELSHYEGMSGIRQVPLTRRENEKADKMKSEIGKHEIGTKGHSVKKALKRHRKGTKSRILRGILCTCLIFAASLTSEASDSALIDASKTGELTIIKVKENSGKTYTLNGHEDQRVTAEGMQGIEFSAVRIADIEQTIGGEGAGTAYVNLDAGFKELAADNGILITSKTTGGKEIWKPEDLEAALYEIEKVSAGTPGDEQITEYVRHADGTVRFQLTDAVGRTSRSELPLGLYLVAETDSSGYVNQSGIAPETVLNPAAPMLVSLPMTDPESVETDGSWLYHVTVYPKNQTASIPIYIVSETDGRTLLHEEDYEIGETVKQIITADAPAVSKFSDDDTRRDYETYVITNTMSGGLSYQQLTEVKLGQRIANPSVLSEFDGFKVLAQGEDYRLLKGASGSTLLTEENAAGTKIFRIEFLDDGIDKLNALDYSAQVAVVFDSVLGRSALEGNAEANTDQPSLAAKNMNTEGYSVNGNENRVYSYHLNIKKTGVSDASKVSFIAAKGSTELTFVKDEDGVYHFYDKDLDSAEAAARETVIRPKSDGTLQIRGLDADSYEFTEKTTEEGHDLMSSSFTVTLTARNPVDGNLANAVISADGAEAQIGISAGTAGFAVDNVKTLVLRTGGSGTGLLYAAAAVFVFVSAVLFLRRGSRKEL